MDWAELLRDYRRAQGLKQDAAARDLGVTQATISRWESGASRPTAAMQGLLLRRLRRLRTPVRAQAWAEIIRRVPTPCVLMAPDGQIEALSGPSAESLGVPVTALEGLTLEEALRGEVLEVAPRIVASGFFEGRVASFETVMRLELNPAIRRGVSIWMHCISWPHPLEDGGIVGVSQGLVVSRAEAEEVRARLGGALQVTAMG